MCVCNACSPNLVSCGRMLSRSVPTAQALSSFARCLSNSQGFTAVSVLQGRLLEAGHLPACFPEPEPSLRIGPKHRLRALLQAFRILQSLRAKSLNELTIHERELLLQFGGREFQLELFSDVWN